MARINKYILNILSEFFLTNSVMALMQSSPTAKHTIHEIISANGLQITNLSPLKICTSKLPRIVGIEIRKEYLAEILPAPNILVVAIVVPLRLMPGMHAMP